MSPLPAVTTESALIGAFACVLSAVLLRQVSKPGRSLVWSRQATVLALVPTGGAATLLVLFCYDVVGITSLINALGYLGYTHFSAKLPSVLSTEQTCSGHTAMSLK